MLVLTATGPTLDGGAVHETLEGERKVAVVVLLSRNLHRIVVATKPSPVTVTLVSPELGPPAGRTSCTKNRLRVRLLLVNWRPLFIDTSKMAGPATDAPARAGRAASRLLVVGSKEAGTERLAPEAKLTEQTVLRG